jgi:O-antigen ligase
VGQRAGVVALAALAPAAMLVVDPAGWYPFGPSKWLVISVLVLGGSALVLRERVPRLDGWTSGALVALLGWLVLAAAVGQDRLYAWTGTPERRFGVVTWGLCGLALVAGSALDPARHARAVLTGLVVAGLGVGGVATAEALGWEPRLLDVGDRLSGSFGSSAYLGAATALLLPAMLAVGLGRGARRDRLAAAVAAVLLAVAGLGSGARAAWVGLAVAAVVVLAARASDVRRATRARPRRALAGGALLLVAAAVLLAVTPVGSRLSSATDPDAAGGRGRLDEWRVAGNVVEDHLLLGVGPEGYRTAFHEGVDAAYERAHGRRQQPDRAHSVPLDLALSGGLPAVGAWLLLVASVGRGVWAALRRGPAWRSGIAAGLVAHLTGQLLLFPVVELEPVAWLLAGLLLASVGAPERRLPRATWWPRLAAGVGLAAVVALASGVTEVVADRRAEVASAALGRGDHRRAAQAAQRAVDLRPDIVRLHLLAAAAAVADEQGLVVGIRHVDDALEVSPHDPIALRTRATLLVERAEATRTDAHVAAAAAEVRRLLSDDPFDAALWRLVARTAALTGDTELVREAGRHAESLTPPEER